MGHDVSHRHRRGDTEAGKLGLAFTVSLAILAIELVGVRLTGSLALLADAAHMGTDAASAGVALFAARLAQRPRTEKRTFGYGRSTVIAALVNASTLIAIAIYLVVEAVRRFGEPRSVGTSGMIAVAAVALLGNGAIGWYLSRGGSGSLNVRAVVVHLAGDAAASAAVIVGALLIAWTGVNAIDPALTILISLLVAWSAYGLFRESTDVLMETAPRGLEADVIREALIGHEGVIDVHDVHVWSLDGERTAASLHVRVPQERVGQGPALVGLLKPLLREQFGVEHATIELECEDCAAPNCEPA